MNTVIKVGRIVGEIWLAIYLVTGLLHKGDQIDQLNSKILAIEKHFGEEICDRNEGDIFDNWWSDEFECFKDNNRYLWDIESFTFKERFPERNVKVLK